MKNLKIKLFYYCLIAPLKCIFFFLKFEKFVWYRKMKGGIWTNYGPIIIWDSVTSKVKNRKVRFPID